MPTGKIIAANDEWILSDTAYNNSQTQQDTVRFLRNVAFWFTSGISGRFLIYTEDNVAIGDWLAQELQSLGHDVHTFGQFQGTFNLANLQSYQAVFLVEKPADNQVLIDYVNSGGCVYVAGGGGFGASVAADRWNTFLARFDLQFASTNNGVGGVMSIESSHPVFFEVLSLYQDNGNSVSMTGPSVYSQLTPMGYGTGSTLAGAFGIVDLDRYELQTGTGLDVSYILADHRLETDDSSALKLQVYNGSSSEALNARARIMIQGPYQKSGHPQDGADAPIATGISASPAVVNFDDRINSSDWSETFTTQITTTGATPGEYRVGLVLEYDTGRTMSETHAVQFRVKRD